MDWKFNYLAKMFNNLFRIICLGNPNEESDLDLLIVIDRDKKDRFHTLLSGQISMRGLDIAKDILVYNKQEW